MDVYIDYHNPKPSAQKMFRDELMAEIASTLLDFFGDDAKPVRVQVHRRETGGSPFLSVELNLPMPELHTFNSRLPELPERLRTVVNNNWGDKADALTFDQFALTYRARLPYGRLTPEQLAVRRRMTSGPISI